jgi:hypothetical protein
MNPFRDPRAAAIERIDSLERENAKLQEALRVQRVIARAPDRAFAQGALLGFGLVVACVAAIAYLGL